MDPLQIMLFVTLILGIGLVLFSLILPKNELETKNDELETNAIEAIDRSITEMDKTMDEFNNMAQDVFKQLDEKYQELLFLYSLIEEKRAEIADIYAQTGGVKQSTPPPKPQVIENKPPQFTNPKHQEINTLVQRGYSVADIAKTLNIGQGEVKLILELGKAR